MSNIISLNVDTIKVQHAVNSDVFIRFMFFKKIVFKKVLKSFRRVLKSKNSLKSYIFKKVQKVKKI
jgi:hypothetical protein